MRVIFTFDDNDHRHFKIIKPLFEKYNARCTFYINIGKDDFNDFLDDYKSLYGQGFEIGSHAYLHQSLINLSLNDVRKDFELCDAKFMEYFEIKPQTFAFPNHDFNEELLSIAREYVLETRNTLVNSYRKSVNTNTDVGEVITVIEDCLTHEKDLVISGHSVYLDNQDLNDNEEILGYSPVHLSKLEEIIAYLVKKNIEIMPLVKALK